ncbi:zinc-dependent alcohol dehydrogenase [Roseicitreum antarcticum]|uniref:zinc-dependent alcohol dehydrogenase n=1 Tax=Roseicitreum antarcticum TaxID=564137 RepID=UPI002109F5F1|nr:zinc-binding alcohol dehydrogenase [Roseicitreum antarcticum]
MPVKTVFSAISRGTERLVAAGEVPASEHDRMRGPGMEGTFPFPVKYGYCNVGEVQAGPLAGRHVFSLFPHQTHFCLPQENLNVLPSHLPLERAVLAANMETALNILWDSGAGAGDRIAVIGAGVVGSLVGYLAAQLPGAVVVLIDINPAREVLAKTLGVDFASTDDAPHDCDVVIHASANPDGLALGLSIAGEGATVIEASWYGDKIVPVPLGGAFHSRRLRLIASQVGHLPPTRLPRWSYARRMATALDLLADDRLDLLISGETPFADLPHRYADILAAPDTLCHRIRY